MEFTKSHLRMDYWITNLVLASEPIDYSYHSLPVDPIKHGHQDLLSIQALDIDFTYHSLLVDAVKHGHLDVPSIQALDIDFNYLAFTDQFTIQSLMVNYLLQNLSNTYFDSPAVSIYHHQHLNSHHWTDQVSHNRAILRATLTLAHMTVRSIRIMEASARIDDYTAID